MLTCLLITTMVSVLAIVRYQVKEIYIMLVRDPQSCICSIPSIARALHTLGLKNIDPLESVWLQVQISYCDCEALLYKIAWECVSDDNRYSLQGSLLHSDLCVGAYCLE